MTRRRVIQVVVFLLLGAIMNVAVAWGCIARFQFSSGPAMISTPNEFAATWARLAKPDWKAEPTRGHRGEAFGVKTHMADAGSWVSPNPAHRGMTFARYLTVEVCAGWPLLALRRVYRLDNAQPPWADDGLRIPVRINGNPFLDVPVQPTWPGFAINTIFYAAVLWMVFAFPFVLRRRRRIKRGLCPACAYPVGGSPVCTECGAALPWMKQANP